MRCLTPQSAFAHSYLTRHTRFIIHSSVLTSGVRNRKLQFTLSPLGVPAVPVPSLTLDGVFAGRIVVSRLSSVPCGDTNANKRRVSRQCQQTLGIQIADRETRIHQNPVTATHGATFHLDLCLPIHGQRLKKCRRVSVVPGLRDGDNGRWPIGQFRLTPDNEEEELLYLII